MAVKDTTRGPPSQQSILVESLTGFEVVTSGRAGDGADSGGRDSGKIVHKPESKEQLQVLEETKTGASEETTKCGIREEGRLSDLQEPTHAIQFPPKRGGPGKTEYSQTGALKDEGVFSEKVKECQLCTTTNAASGIITSEGGMVKAEGVQLVCPPGAVDNPVTIKITLEDPVKYYGLIVQRGLENDVMFGGPIINLQPNGHLFKKPVTLTTKIEIEEGNFKSEDVLVLHGTEAKDGKISWQDITQNAIINVATKEVSIEVQRFSVIANLLTVAWIRAKEVVSRLNLLSFNYTLSVLFKKDSSELALVFMSQDIFHEPYYVNASALVQLVENDGFSLVRSIDGPTDKRIYNSEDLQVSVHLGEDYQLSDNQHSSLDVTVESHVWWNTGRTIKLPLKVINEVSILSGRISVQGQYGHNSENRFCEQDQRGYVRCLLRVEGAVYNVIPIAEKLGTPEGLMTQITNSWKDENEQLEIVLQPWLKKNGETKDPDSLRKGLEDLKEEDYKVTQRGQMHIRNLRELAVKISDLKIKNAESRTYFSDKIQDLCETVLRDCCIELESSVEDVGRVASYQSYGNHLENYPQISKGTASKYEQMCSSSEESMAKHFLAIIPHLIQDVKSIFRDEIIPEVQNGLRGLHKETLDQLASDVREAKQNNKIQKLVCEVCEILENLCLNNRDSKHSTELIRDWGSSLAVYPLLGLLKPFFQKCPQYVRLHKRLERFSRHIRGIVKDKHVDEVFVRDFFDVSSTLIHFAKFDPAKLVKFELTDSTNHPVTCTRDSVVHDTDSDTYSQVFCLRKESEDELLLHAAARVHSKGQVRKVGAIILPASAEEAFDKCITRHSTDVAVIKLKVSDSQDIRVVLCSTQKEELSLLVDVVLKRQLREEVMDWKGSQISRCHLTMRALATKSLGTGLSLRLVYKWESEAIFLESKDFVAHADLSAERAWTAEVRLVAVVFAWCRRILFLETEFFYTK
ncbi:hypothetical protein OS493_034480 [Desmophyllum pertusum]|uniref:ZU5 domain-containing protein n=1 Tax=Desmophyllum pertusum TaxID=174260 RepID=A0A9W9YWJ4_9CNID|nr:hypothetical protein OS493_034480 [Desmophyllum pertusum]